MVRICKEESFHQRQGYEIMIAMAKGTPVRLGHPVLGLDELVIRDPRLERFEELRILEILDLGRLLKLGRVHVSDVVRA
jgi:hypothetical protein